jgi:hypothetical protein
LPRFSADFAAFFDAFNTPAFPDEDILLALLQMPCCHDASATSQPRCTASRRMPQASLDSRKYYFRQLLLFRRQSAIFSQHFFAMS